MENRFTVRRISNSVAVMQNLPEDMELQVQPNSNFNAFTNHGFTPDAPYEIDRRKSFVHHTIEALPRLDYYRNDLPGWKRPSLGELHGEEKDLKVSRI